METSDREELETNEVEEIAEEKHEDDNEPTAWGPRKRTQRVQATILKKLPKKTLYKKKSKKSDNAARMTPGLIHLSNQSLSNA
uniref:Uncharacterized protein n=1 Tax=Acrobeloides nanus TaxID=290746 RepID=A0A914DAR4_9BILA